MGWGKLKESLPGSPPAEDPLPLASPDVPSSPLPPVSRASKWLTAASQHQYQAVSQGVAEGDDDEEDMQAYSEVLPGMAQYYEALPIDEECHMAIITRDQLGDFWFLGSRAWVNQVCVTTLRHICSAVSDTNDFPLPCSQSLSQFLPWQC